MGFIRLKGFNINIQLGDLVEKALSSIGITSERVDKWLGMPCGCARRKEKLNQLSLWASRVLSGKKDNAKEYLEKLTEDE